MNLPQPYGPVCAESGSSRPPEQSPSHGVLNVVGIVPCLGAASAARGWRRRAAGGSRCGCRPEPRILPALFVPPSRLSCPRLEKRRDESRVRLRSAEHCSPDRVNSTSRRCSTTTPAWPRRVRQRVTFVKPLISSAEIQGTILMWTWIGEGDEGATTVSCLGRGSPESVADAADSLDAVGNGAEFPAEAANHGVDGVAATVVGRAPYLAE